MARAPTEKMAGSTGLADFDEQVSQVGIPGLYSTARLKVIQVNIGLKCNLICRHCHVNSSPQRTEAMDWKTMEAVLRLAEELDVKTVDITGGAPEMNPEFRRFVAAIRDQNREVIVRSNLTILLEPGYEDLPEFFRAKQVQLAASLPCYNEENVDSQRGNGVYQESIEAIRRLNRVGYGVEPGLILNLIYNPGGPNLPPNQAILEVEYKHELLDRFDIQFNNLHTITNVPIGRFRGDLQKQKKLDAYLATLREAFNATTVEPLMCRHQISVAWDGALYDCDFNLALRWPTGFGASTNIHDVNAKSLLERRVVTGDHCYACTAGAGSSCGGALV